MFDVFLHDLGFAVCHQLPERSSIFNGTALIACARCSGIYLAFTFSAVYLLIAEKRKTLYPKLNKMIPAAAFIIIMALDGLTSYLGLRPTDNSLRLLTGLMAGSALPLLLIPAVNYFMLRETEEAAVLGTPAKAAAFYLLPFLYFGVLYFAGSFIQPLINYFAGFSILFTFFTVNLSFSGVLLMSSKRTEKYRAEPVMKAALVILGLVFSLLQLRALALLHTYLNML